MKKMLSLIALVSMIIMMIPLAATPVRAAGPGDLHIYYEGTAGWGPVDADPAIAYDTASGGLIFNTYEGLIAWKGEAYYEFIPVLATNIPTRNNITLTITNASAVGADPTSSTWSGGRTIVGWVDELADGFGAQDAIFLTDGVHWNTWTVDSKTGTTTITLTLWRGSYVFNLQPAGTIPFYNCTGLVQDTFDSADAEYSFEHALVLDVIGQPIWMYDKPLFDLPDHSYFNNATAINLAHLIDDAIVADAVANTLTINVGCRFPDNAFMQIIANSWGSILNKAFVVAGGNWDGNLYTSGKYGAFPDWWVDWAGEGFGIDYATGDPLDQLVVGNYCGTGPYYLDTINSVTKKVIYKRNVSYRGGWPAPGCNDYIDTYVVDYVSVWATRKATFLAGSYDSVYVPRTYMFELLDNVTKEPPAGKDSIYKTIKNIVPALSEDVVLFNFKINPASPYLGTGTFPNGIPLDFFNNTNVRKAFAYAFNWSTFGQQVYYGESQYRKNSLVLGLFPDYYNDAAVPTTKFYYESAANAEAMLKSVLYNGTSVWDSGFTVQITWNSGNDVRRQACEMIRNFFTALSTYDGRSGSAPPFKVTVTMITWPNTIGDMVAGKSTVWAVGWLADFADADNFVRTFQHSQGSFCYYQNYNTANGWSGVRNVMIDTAILTPDGPARQALYNNLSDLYYNDCPSFPLNIPTGRRWCQYWTKGWYYDAVYPAFYLRAYWKADDCWFDISGSIAGVSDGSCNMKDIAYLVAKFNAPAPVPGLPTSPKWVGVYGANGGVDVYGDRVSNMKDIAGAIQHFNHKQNTLTP